jgi:Flp pilus assembly protein TadD
MNAAKELLEHEPDNWDYRFSMVESMIHSPFSNEVPARLENYEHGEGPTETNQAILGSLWYQYGDITNAIRLMGNAVNLSPSNDQLRMAYAVYLVDNKQYGPAVSNLHIVAERNPGESRIHQLYGFALGEQGRTAEAEQQLRLSIHLDQHNATALNNLAYLLLIDNRGSKEALELALSAVQLERKGYTLDTLGYAYYRRGKFNLARRYLEEAEQLLKKEQESSDPEMDFHLGLVYAELGEMQKAVPRFRSALQKNVALKAVLSRERYYTEIENAVSTAE